MWRPLAVVLAMILTALPAAASDKEGFGDEVAFSAVATLPGTEDAIDGVTDGSSWVVLVTHSTGSEEEFYWDSSQLRVVITDGSGRTKGTVAESPKHFAIQALALVSGLKLPQTIDLGHQQPTVEFITIQSTDSLGQRVASFMRQFGTVEVRDLRYQAEQGNLGVLTTSSSTSGYTTGWNLDLWGNTCVYEYSYRDLSNNNYWYVSSTAYNSCYYVDVSAWGNSVAQGFGDCQYHVWRGNGGTSTTRSVLETTWPTGSYTINDPACSAHAGWNSSWSQIAPWDGLNAWMP